MKLSIIIPVYNSEKTLRICLNALFKSEYREYEVIVVDDASTDKSQDIITEFPCHLIKLNHNSGAAKARNVGAQQANGDILVFLDADVRIDPETLNNLVQELEGNEEAHAITGMLALDSSQGNLFSEFKNIYMNYTFSKYIGKVDFLYGSLMAIRKKDFLPFDESYPVTDDTELGQRFKSLGKTIILSGLLKVTHLKNYTFMGLMRNDFRVPFWWTKTFLMYNGIKDILKKHRFSHSGTYQFLNISLTYLIILSIPFWGYILIDILTLFLFCLYLLNNFDFFVFIDKNKRGRFLIPYLSLTYIDHLVMGAGIFCGFIHFGFKNNQKIMGSS